MWANQLENSLGPNPMSTIGEVRDVSLTVLNIRKTAKDEKSDENTNCQKGDQFHNGFKGNGRNKTLMAFRGLQASCSEQCGERP
jgi:hypothetical protein